jgi:hypothetical protein
MTGLSLAGGWRYAQIIHVRPNEVPTAPQVRFMDDSRLLRHVRHAPEDRLLHEEGVRGRHAVEGPRSVILPSVHDVKVVSASIFGVETLQI